jgi:hypothetical protein
MSTNGNRATATQNGTIWEGYSHYKSVSKSVAQTIDNAIEAYALLDSLHTEHAQITPDTAAEARSYILGAVLKLKPELERDRDEKDVYKEILSRWEDGDDDDGYITQLHSTELQQNMPGWMFQLLMDIRTAGWELGYLKAGRSSKEEPEDVVDAEVKKMFNE